MSNKNILWNELSNGERLKKLRERAGLSQYDLGDLVGVSWRNIYYYEKESKNPPIKLLKKLCSALGVTSDEYLGIEAIPEKDFRNIEGKLLKKFIMIKEIPDYRKRALYQVIDTFIELNRLQEELKINTESSHTNYGKRKTKLKTKNNK